MSEKTVDKYYEKLKAMSLSQLEKEIIRLYPAYLKSGNDASWKIQACLSERKFRLNKNFKFTDTQVKQIEKINQLLIEATDKLIKKSKQLHQQMQTVLASGDDFLENFHIESKLILEFYDEDSILLLEEDENDGQSNYQAMVEVLDEALTMPLRYFISYNNANDETERDFYNDDLLDLNWNIEELSAPQLQHIPYFCYASHSLFCHSHHSYSDIIRIKSFRNEINVCWLKEIKV